ncbi:uncharacterized protein LOC116414617, partial [Apis florea]|uniref:uncharacterized protein LOC116414617 n=1 Tax=Apis florea TaxID=7463 RepID=UPI0012FE9521
MSKKVYVVPHTHWDREWFFTSSKAKVYLMKNLQDVLDCLEKGGAFKSFLLDGQSSLITDYLKWRPQDTERVKQLVQEGKLALGPWYTQTDQFLPSGESIVNNLRIGIKQSDRLGGHLPVAYVPDSFGQESSMPQIYRGFGIKDAVLYRGFCQGTASQSEFIWRGEDNSEVTVFRMACGYFVGGVIDETKLAQLMTQEPFKTIVQQATTSNILFPNGSDMAPIRFDLPTFITKLKRANHHKFDFEVSSLTDYIAAVKKQQPQLVALDGEQDSGKDMRVHKSISSSRADLKKMNTKLQNYLSNVMQPALTLGDYLGIDYPRNAINDLWQKMCKNAAHDSMGNCVSDQVNEDIKSRYVAVKKRLPVSGGDFECKPGHYSPSRNFLIQDATGKNVPYEVNAIEDVTELVNSATIQLNPGQKIYRPAKVYRLQLDFQFDNLPAFGYQQFYLIPLVDQEIALTSRKTGRTIANEFYRISVNDDGSLNILDKMNQHLYQNQAIIEENGDAGDSYNYSPAKKDLVIYSTSQKYQVQVASNNLVQKLRIDFAFLVPGDLAKRSQGIVNTLMPVQLEVSLHKKSKIINFKIKVDNTLPKSHRLCIDFASGIVAKTSIADIQFGTIKRPRVKEQELNEWHHKQAEWQEKPVSINTMQSFVALADKKRCLALAPQGVREYECIGLDNATVRLTIFRTYGMLGKRDLLYRPGRASGDETVPTPQAQLNHKLDFELALITEQTGFDQSDLANEVKDMETPLQVYDWFQTTNQLSISTIEKDPERKGYAIRFYNPKFIQFKNVLSLINNREMMVKAYFVNHTHWDREWYFTTQDAQVLSDQLFTEVLDELEQHPEANFTLDGQMSIVDDYVEIHPEAQARIHALVERKQLFIGPWYTQTDALIPNAESLLRNLIIGIFDARANYGEPMML